MAENRWISTSSTVYSTGANWSLGAKPGASDDVVVGAGTADILEGFDANGQTFGVNSFHRHHNSTSQVGTSANPLRLATVSATSPLNPFDPAGKVIVQGPREFYYVNNSWASTVGLYIDTDTQDIEIEVNGAIDGLYCLKGRITALSAAVLGLVDVGWRTSPATDVLLTIQAGPGEVFSLNQAGGTVINTGGAPVVDLAVSSGTFDHGENAGAITKLIQTGGLVIHRSAAATTNAFILGGTCDYSQDEREKTINLLRVYPGATFKQNPYVTIAAGGSVFPVTPIIPGAGF